MKSNKETPMYAVAMYNQTSNDKGDRKENKSGSSLIGFENRMLMPNVMNGMVKSTAVRLS
jgi:hypothetical protein